MGHSSIFSRIFDSPIGGFSHWEKKKFCTANQGLDFRWILDGLDMCYNIHI